MGPEEKRAGAPGLMEEDIGSPVATISLEVEFQPSWKGALDRVGETFLAELSWDDERYGTRRAEDWTPPGGDPGSQGTVEIRGMPLPGGMLTKRLRVVQHPDSRVSAEAAYAVDGEGEALWKEAMEIGQGTLEGMHNTVREERDHRWQAKLRNRLSGEIGGMIFLDLLERDDRRWPLLLVSEADSYPEGFFDWVEADLAGKAVAAELDEGATSFLTRQIGKKWSCFSGSVRVYHPIWDREDVHDDHFIWRRRQVVPDGQDAGFAKRRFRQEALHEVFVGLSAWHEELLTELEEERAALEHDLKQALVELGEARREIDALKKGQGRP